MANVVRLVNGGTIQVRTGVLAGVGPAGPRGLVGPVGPDGPQGPVGPQGEIGQILQIQARANVSSTTTVNPTTDTTVAFGTVAYDDMSACTSSTNFTLLEAGDYMFNCYVEFSEPGNPGNGTRRLSLVSQTNGVIWVSSTVAEEAGSTFLEMSAPYRVTTGGEVVNIVAYSTDDLSAGINSGALTITRVGSGPRGVQGEQGPQGIQGIQGPPGPTGPQGNASGGFATYADLV